MADIVSKPYSKDGEDTWDRIFGKKDKKEEYDAIIEYWYYAGGQIHGDIYGDKKKRFVDGYFIHTSNVWPATSLKEGDIIYTKNSMYKLGKPYGK